MNCVVWFLFFVALYEYSACMLLVHLGSPYSSVASCDVLFNICTATVGLVTAGIRCSERRASRHCSDWNIKLPRRASASQ